MKRVSVCTEIDKWIVQLDTELEMCANTSTFNVASLQNNLDNLVSKNNCFANEYRQLMRHSRLMSKYDSCILPEDISSVYLRSRREKRDTRILELEFIHSKLNECDAIRLGFNPTRLL